MHMSLPTFHWLKLSYVIWSHLTGGRLGNTVYLYAQEEKEIVSMSTQ